MLGHRMSLTSLSGPRGHQETRGDTGDEVRWDITYSVVANPTQRCRRTQCHL